MLTRRMFLILGSLAGVGPKRKKPRVGVYSKTYSNIY